MKMALYLRVSTSEQATDNQLPALQDYAASRGYEVTQIYQENESAWKAGHQKELAKLLADIRGGKRKYDILLVWALDRLTRGGAAAILNLVDTFKSHGVKVISLQEPWTDAPGEIGEILYAIAGWVARMESQRKSERTKAGLERACGKVRDLEDHQGARIKRGAGGQVIYCGMLTGKKTGIEKQRTFLSLMIGTYGMTKKGTIFDGSNG